MIPINQDYYNILGVNKNSEENEINQVSKLFKESNLPESIDKEFINKLLIEIRKKIYNL